MSRPKNTVQSEYGFNSRKEAEEFFDLETEEKTDEEIEIEKILREEKFEEIFMGVD